LQRPVTADSVGWQWIAHRSATGSACRHEDGRRQRDSGQDSKLSIIRYPRTLGRAYAASFERARARRHVVCMLAPAVAEINFHAQASPMGGCRTAIGVAWLSAFGVLLVSTASADGITPIEVTLLGPSAVRVRVSRGSTMPCDSGDDRSIIAGKFEPGQVVKASTLDDCVCVQQTYEPFTDVDWAAGSIICRPQRCTWAGRSKHCVPATDHTIRIAIRSKR
jgi:hypothetical protein